MSAKAIQLLNDKARKSFGCKVMVTRGVHALNYDEQMMIFTKVRNFKDFTKDNDPHGEHDFGSFMHGGQKIFWKFDYYDKSLEYGSEDPADPTITTRVLTVMLASEY